MTPSRPSGGWPMGIAFGIWFAHFLLSWAATEVWPRQWRANVWAWALTAIALAALGAYWRRLESRSSRGELTAWSRRLGRGAIAIAAVAIVFSAFPSLVLLP